MNENGFEYSQTSFGNDCGFDNSKMIFGHDYENQNLACINDYCQMYFG